MSKELQANANPEVADSLIPYSLYSDHKQARLKAQNERLQAQNTIAYLERQAKKQLKEAERRKKSLENYYSIVQSRVEDYHEKQRVHQNALKHVEQLKQANFSLKITSAAKRASARSKLESINKIIASEVKSFRSISQRKIQEQRELQRSLLKKKNETITSKIVEANANSRVRAMGERRAASSEVKSQLIRVQESLKQRELSKMAQLNMRQKELMELAEKGRKQREHYEATLSQVRTMPIESVYKQVKAKASSRRMRHRHSFI